MKTLILSTLLFSSITIYSQSDFSGNWKLNSEKSDFSNVDPLNAAAVKLVVEQKSGMLTYQKDDRPKQTLKIDSTAQIEIKGPNNTIKVSMKPTPDKKGITETRNYIYSEGQQGTERQRIRNWTLSDDKKTLTILDNIITTDGRVAQMMLVYERE